MPTRSTDYPGGVQTLLRCPKMIEQMRIRARKIKRRAILISPVKTGQYKASWHYRSGVKHDKAWARVYNTAPHAAFLEFGTRFMRRRKILARAVDSVRKS